MSEENTANNEPRDLPESQAGRVPWVAIVLSVGLAVSLSAALYLHNNLVNVRLETLSLKRELASIRQTVNTSDVNASQTISALRSELENVRKETASSTEEARRAAKRQAEAVAARVSTSLSQKQEEQTKQISDQLDQIKSRADQATTRLTDITAEVSNVRTEVASSRTAIDKSIADLHRVTGDLGVLSGLIATNSKELAALKELGDREYFEFNLRKQAGPQKVGDIVVRLKKADTKRNRFTLEIVADDKRVEKKDRTINEPVQFYVVNKARIPYELVVNEVKKDIVVGYLAVPKVKTPAQRL